MAADNVINTLTDIVGTAVEHDLHSDPTTFIQQIDLYRVHLETHSNQQFATVASFQQFLSSQNLLDNAAANATSLDGELVIAPKAMTRL